MKIYLAAPYTHPDPEIVKYRVDKINETAALLMSEGHIVFSPISHSHYIAVDNDLPTGFEFWQEMNHSFIDWCDVVYVLYLEGYAESKGVADEIEYCKKTNTPFYVY